MLCSYTAIASTSLLMPPVGKNITLTNLWKFFHYSPKRAECLKEVQRVIDLPELKIVKPSDICWLARECCVKAVNASYSAIVNALNNIYEQTHEPETLVSAEPCVTHQLCQQCIFSIMFFHKLPS